MTTNIFEQASRMKLGFQTTKGQLSVEQVWDLPLTSKIGQPNLDALAIGLDEQLGTKKKISFVDSGATGDPTVQLRFDIVKHIIDARLSENKAASEAAAKRERNQKIMAELASRKDKAIATMSDSDLEKLLAE